MRWALMVVVGVALLVLIIYLVVGSTTRPHQRAVLPSHYNPENYIVDPSRQAGWCSHCKLLNEPGYRYCEQCARKLYPGRPRSFDRERDPFSGWG